jgi:hypothetical protein
MDKEFKLSYKQDLQLCEISIDEILICVYYIHTHNIKFYAPMHLLDLKEILFLIMIFNNKKNETENKN